MDRRGKSSPDAPRDQQDTIRVDSEVLGRLKSLSRIDDDVDELLAVPVGDEPKTVEPRTEQVSVAFDLTKPPVIPLTDVRPPQVSIPFELSRESPVVLAPRELRPTPEPRWASVPPVPHSPFKWIAFVVLVVALSAELWVSGVVGRLLGIVKHLR